MAVGEIIGLIAGALTTGSFLPQVLKVLRSKSARDISLLFSLMILAGNLSWLVYGFYLKALPIILWNILGMSLVLLLIWGKLKYGVSKSEKKSVEKKPADPD